MILLKCFNSYYIIKSSDIIQLKYLTAILNTKLISFYLVQSNLILWSEKWSKKTPQIRKKSIDLIPIPSISPEAQKPFIEKVDKILEITKQPFYDAKNPPKEQKILEKEIDEMVYELYGLSEDEVKVVEESLV